jgi:hypothetical protein
MISQNEKLLLFMLETMGNDRNQQAIILQSYIAKHGLLGEETAIQVRELLKEVKRR